MARAGTPGRHFGTSGAQWAQPTAVPSCRTRGIPDLSPQGSAILTMRVCSREDLHDQREGRAARAEGRLGRMAPRAAVGMVRDLHVLTRREHRVRGTPLGEL